MSLLKKVSPKIIKKILLVAGLIVLIFFIYYITQTIFKVDKHTEAPDDFKYLVPEGWNISTSTNMTIISKDQRMAVDKNIFLEDEPVIVISARQVSSTTTLDSYLKSIGGRLLPNTLTYLVKEYKVNSKELVTLKNGSEAYLIDASFNLVTPTSLMNKKSIEKSIRSLSLITIYKSTFYILYTTAEASKLSSSYDVLKENLLKFNPNL